MMHVQGKIVQLMYRTPSYARCLNLEKENSTVMLCKEALKRRVHKREPPREPNRKTWDITGLRYVLILHIVVVQRLHCVLDVLCSLCGITVRKDLERGGGFGEMYSKTYLWVQVQGRREMLDSISLVVEHFVQLSKKVVHVCLIWRHVL